MIHVTQHACQRYAERIEPCRLETARNRILAHTKAIEAAADFGCEIVRCGDGSRLVVDGLTVVTVYAPHCLPRQLRRARFPIGDNEWL